MVIVKIVVYHNSISSYVVNLHRGCVELSLNSGVRHLQQVLHNLFTYTATMFYYYYYTVGLKFVIM